MTSESLYTLEAADYPDIQPEGETLSLLAVLEQVATERYHQDLQHGGPGHDDMHSPLEWETLLTVHVAQLLSTCDQPAPDYPDRLIKIAALAVAARQSWDRQHPVRTCRVCGCTDTRACFTDGIPCHWVAPDLCSACVVNTATAIAKRDGSVSIATLSKTLGVPSNLIFSVMHRTLGRTFRDGRVRFDGGTERRYLLIDLHASDCAMRNNPTLDPRPCSCGAVATAGDADTGEG